MDGFFLFSPCFFQGGGHKKCARRGVWKLGLGGGVHNPDPLACPGMAQAIVYLSLFKHIKFNCDSELFLNAFNVRRADLSFLFT